MNYEEFIQNILNTRGRFGCGNEYHERHHIVPKCLGGINDEDNLIDLYAREHFEAHRLLAEENPENVSLVYAYGCMAWANNDNQERYRVTPEEYEHARINLSNSLKGKPKSKEHRENLSKSKKGKPLSEEVKTKLSESLKGRIFTEEHKSKISKSLQGREFTEEHKNNISKGKKGKPASEAQLAAIKIVAEKNKGRKHSEESKAKISASQKGKIVSEESKRKMSESAKKRQPNRSMPIAQCDLISDKVIKEWESAAAAYRATGINNSTILKCAKGTIKQAGGFVWKFI